MCRLDTSSAVGSRGLTGHSAQGVFIALDSRLIIKFVYGQFQSSGWHE